MNEQTPTLTLAEADAQVEQARHLAQEKADARDATALAIEAAQAEETRINALPEVSLADMAALENARRAARRYSAELLDREAAHAAAMAALEVADKAAHRARMQEAHAEALALIPPIEKTVAKFTEKICPMLAAVRERVAVAVEHAAAAGECPPSLPGIGARLAEVDATDEAAVLLALGSALTAEREHAAYLAALDRDAAEREREEAERAAARAAFDALPDERKEDARLTQFDEAVDRLALATGSDPARGRGYAIDALRRMVARSQANPFPGGRNPYAPVLVQASEPFDEARELDAIATRHRDAQAAAQAERDASGWHDPLAAR